MSSGTVTRKPPAPTPARRTSALSGKGRAPVRSRPGSSARLAADRRTTATRRGGGGGGARRRRRARTAPPSRPPARRLVALLIAMMLALVGIVARLAVLQVKDASAYQELARNQRVRQIALPPSRGSMFDRNGHELAMSLPAKAVFADPALVTDPADEAGRLAAVLDLDPQTLAVDLSKPGRFVYVARGVDPAVAARIGELKLPGIGFLDESRRYYPDGSLAPQVLGFVGVDGQGLSGLETEYQTLLAGRPGREVVEEDPSGTLIPQGSNVDVPPVAGDDLILTLDKDIQFRAQTALAAAVKQNHAKGGTIVVLDPHSGDILAMASYPWFDPNDFRASDPSRFRNRAITDAYEPGSVNKVITASAALEEGVLNLKERVIVPDYYQLYDHTFHDAHPHPTEAMTLGDIIAYSSNIGAIKTASMLGRDRLYEYLTKFGLGVDPGTGFPGETGGILPPAHLWSGTSMGTIPIGQGIAVSPLQMASVYATIANGGVWTQPRLVKATAGSDGNVTPAPPADTRRVVSEATAANIARFLAYAVEVGTGKEAQIPGFWTAGKTGTARKPLPDRLGYYTDRYVASFIGFVPAASPALVVAAVIDEPTTVFGGIAAAPLFQDVARFGLAALRVPPAPPPAIPPHAIGS